jgi:hypothetical protein
MTSKQKPDTQVAGGVLNPKYVHGRVEKVTAEGLWLEGQGVWHHFEPGAMRGQVLPRKGQLVVCAQNKAGRIVSIAMQHELQTAADNRIEPEQPNTTEQPNTALTQQPNTATIEIPDNIDSLVDYRQRADALGLAIALLNLEAHYGIDRDDVFRVAQEVIRWIQTTERK